jgi:hypothetical protein
MHNIPAARSFSSTGVRNASESSTKLAGVIGVDWASREDRIEGMRETMENASRDWTAKDLTMIARWWVTGLSMLIYQVVFKRWLSVRSCCCVIRMRSIAIDVTLHALSVPPFHVLRRVSLCISRPNGSVT